LSVWACAEVESPTLAAALSQAVRDAYVAEGYEVIDVPAGPIEARRDFVLQRLGG